MGQLHPPLPCFGRIDPLTALAFLLAALSIWLWRVPQAKRRPQIAQACGAAACVAAVGQYFLSVNAIPLRGSDLLAIVTTPQHPVVLNPTISFILIGCSLCILESKTHRGESPAEWLLAASAFFPFTALISSIYDQHSLLNPLAHPFTLAKMELHTAIGLLALCVAALTLRPGRGWMARFVSSRPEGVIARRLFPSGIFALLALGWVTKTGDKAGLYGPDDGTAILVASAGLTIGLLIRKSMNALAALEARRQSTEANLLRSEEHLKMALKGAKIGTWEWDMHTNEVKWSESIADIFGLPQGAFDGRYETYLSLIHPADRDALKARLRYALDHPGEPYISEHRIIWRDGSLHWLSARGDVIRDEDGKPLRMAGTTMDITEHKILERALIEASNREQQRLGQDLHDDLGQWLTSVREEARTLSQNLVSKSEADAAHAEKIATWASEAIDRTRMLVRGMAPAVIETGGLAAALREVATSTKQMFQIRCHCTCDESLAIHDTEVSLQLYRIAQEAISNALRHSKATEVWVNLAPEPDGWVCLSIRDNGRGIPYPLPKGPGMGLRIMQFRAGLLGGHVDIHPAENGGTEVVCRFSLKE